MNEIYQLNRSNKGAVVFCMVHDINLLDENVNAISGFYRPSTESGTFGI